MRPRVLRMGIFRAAAEAGTPKIIMVQAAWRNFRRRRAEELLDFAWAEFIPSTSARVVFAESFLRPPISEIQKKSDGTSLANRLGRCWFSALRGLKVLNQQVPHFSVGGFTHAEDVEESVRAS